ncbi:hypothetical protein PHISP_02098 [Aspergillus sp. HF37]|nr:hypothetical protein PHISP_02098 [Aspergillus sp. HF37]
MLLPAPPSPSTLGLPELGPAKPVDDMASFGKTGFVESGLSGLPSLTPNLSTKNLYGPLKGLEISAAKSLPEPESDVLGSQMVVADDHKHQPSKDDHARPGLISNQVSNVMVKIATRDVCQHMARLSEFASMILLASALASHIVPGEHKTTQKQRPHVLRRRLQMVSNHLKLRTAFQKSQSKNTCESLASSNANPRDLDVSPSNPVLELDFHRPLPSLLERIFRTMHLLGLTPGDGQPPVNLDNLDELQSIMILAYIVMLLLSAPDRPADAMLLE